MSEHHRPHFHVRPATGWINDPNAPLHLGGRYHLFCQHNPRLTEHDEIHWAHFSSPDLVRWRTHPIALAPRRGGPDADGCWSGSAVVIEGEPWLVYSGKLDDVPHQTVCVARPDPGGESWTAEAEPVLASAPEGDRVVEWRDPFLWRERDEVRMLMGAGYRDGTGAALLYASNDLHSWRPLGELCSARDPAFGAYDTGDAWECPQLLRRDGRGLLVLSVWREQGGPEHVAYASGALAGDRLLVETVGRFDHGPDFYAPALTVDDGGRCLLWGWSWEGRDQAAVDADGWAGVLTVPRVVELAADGTPRMLPAPELAALRGVEQAALGLALEDGAALLLDGSAGNAVDIQARVVPPPGGLAWLRVLADPGGTELTEIGVDARTGEVYVDRGRSSLDPGSHRGTWRMPVGLDDRGGVDLRVVVDASILEVFAADGHALTARVYPTSPDSVALLVGAAGGTAAADVRWWQVHAQDPATAPEP